MDTRDDPAAPVRPIPGFRPRPALLMDPPPAGIPAGSPDPDSRPETLADSPQASGGGLYERPPLRPDRNGTRTATSDSTGDVPKASAKETAKLVAGLLGLVVAGVATLVRLRRGVQLRRPTVGELDDVAAPLARIAVRHVPAGMLTNDLADVAAAAAATGAYLSVGPLIEAVFVDAGLPDDVQGEPA